MADTVHTEGELDLHRLLGVLKSRKWYLIGTFIAVVALVGVFTFMQAPTYRATADILISSRNLSLQALGLPQELGALVGSMYGGTMPAHVELIRSEPVMERLAMRLAGDHEYMRTLSPQRAGAGTAYATPATAPSTALILGSITVRQVGNTDILRIETVAQSPLQAMKIANHLAFAYQESDQARSRIALQAMIAFLDEKIRETRRDLELNAAELAEYARQIGMSWQTQAAAAKITTLEQLRAAARVELEDYRAQLETVERFLVGVKDEMLEQFAGPDGAAVLVELTDKLNLIRSIQRDIAQLERDRETAFRAGDYIRAQGLERQIIQKRKDLETTATRQFKVLEQLPQFEKLIVQQLELQLKVIALENRVAVLERTTQEEVDRLAETALELARLVRELDVTEALYSLLLTQSAKTGVAVIAERGSVEIVSPASLPQAPFRPNKPLNLLVGVFLGVLGGVGVAFLREALDTTFRSPEEVEQTLGLPLAAVVPRLPSPKKKHPFEEVRALLLPSLPSQGVERDAFAALSTNLRFLSPDKNLRSVLITGPGPGVGKSIVSANLALAASSARRRVLIVEADVRRPVLAETFGLAGGPGAKDKRPGLTELVLGSTTRDEAVQRIAFEGFDPVDFLSAGATPPNAVDFFASHAFEQTLAQLIEAYDLVIIDSPPVNVVADPVVLGRQTGGVLLVVDIGTTTKKEAELAKQTLVRGQATLLGVVLNKMPRSGKGGYYGGYYGSYSSGYYDAYYSKRHGAKKSKKPSGPNGPSTPGVAT